MKVLVELNLEVDIPEDSSLEYDKLTKVKEWLWTERRDEILQATRLSGVASVSPLTSCQTYDTPKKLLLLDSIARAQRQYLLMQEAPAVFSGLLLSMLDLMSSEYGFIGEMMYETDGTMYLQSHAITNIAWNAETRELYERTSATGLRFQKFDNLFGSVITSKEVVISNNPREDPRAGGVPKGHPPLNAFLGVPLFDQGFSNMIGMIGIANKPGGYAQDDIDFIEPFVVTCSNLIQAYNTRQENKRLINTLEEKVSERTQELSLTNERLEAANKRVVAASAAQLTHFACMSHEIRTPLNCIIGLSSLLQEMGLSEKQKEAISMIVTSGELLCAVVNDILDFSKLESGNVLIEIRPVSLQDTLDSVVNSIEHKAQSKRIAFETMYTGRLPEKIETDGNRLQQILYNLLGNALKFSDKGGSVELFVDYVPHNLPCDDESIASKTLTNSGCGSGNPMASSKRSQIPSESLIGSGLLRFSVKDYGRGIDTDDFSKIFEPFRQANRDTEKLYGGTGLGLAITSRLVERLGGRITVESEIGNWSKFTVDLPVTAVAQLDIARSLADACILYVDHPNEANRQVVSTLGVPFEHFVSCQDMYDWFIGESKSDRLSERFLVCLIQEDLCSVDVLRKISQTLHLALITFGPTHDRIPESHLHVRSLSCRIRSVLLKAISDIRSEIVDPTHHGGRCPTLLAPLDILKDVEVLIAEDNVINQKVICRMLQRSGVERIDVAQNGQEAVEMCASKHYDVIFMDMQMPIMCGDEACRIILESYKGRPRRPKIAFVSAHVSTTFETQAFDAGADGFLSKPFNVKMFEEFIRSLDLCPLAGPCGA